MREQYKEFEEKLNKNEFLRKHYECMPFIGEKYRESGLLLIGESHYVPEDAVECVNIEDFYDTDFDDLPKGEYKDWINTRNVFEKRVYNKCDFKNFFSNPATEIARVINRSDNLTMDQRIAAMHYYAFMNYFKRPSYDAGKTIEGLTGKDYRYAYEISSAIIEILAPELIIFLSKKAYYSFCESDKNDKLRSQYTVKSVSHPSSCWWNRKRKDGRTAQKDFYDYISTIL